MLQALEVISKFPFAGENIIPILQNFLSTFSWMDIQRTLPVSGGREAIDMNQFVSNQENLSRNGDLKDIISSNIRSLSSLS